MVLSFPGARSDHGCGGTSREVRVIVGDDLPAIANGTDGQAAVVGQNGQDGACVGGEDPGNPANSPGDGGTGG